MEIVVSENAQEMGQRAAKRGAQLIREALRSGQEASIIVATGASQFETLNALVHEPDIDWSRVTGFHLDEYIGINDQHPASFRRYLRERFADLVPLKAFHYVNGTAPDPDAECARLAELIRRHPISVAFIGIGENGHIAFNDPPADFETRDPYLVVQLDDACRQQQLGEGWFPTFDDVPSRALSMSPYYILQSKHIICSVPDERKALAVRNSVEGTLSPDVPASILQQHSGTTLFLDRASASKLKPANS